LAVGVDETWFTDAVDRFFVKRGGSRRQQGDVVDAAYQPFAVAAGLPAASIPSRPTPAQLVQLSISDHRERLRDELQKARAPIVVTLGEEARQVVLGIAEECSGPPVAPLDGRSLVPEAYGEAGVLRIGDVRARWHAVVHPGNRNQSWTAIHDGWILRRASEA
jgi:uracil-DNA glycosylase